ncbi:universal stress protein [Kitasatospora sp. CM 4170]|uniref:Universal stress protein n=1 Tax=Kitasatospora aburaviensis TaxID=67265 RepID=A0ABW1F953_9ACTN|nr:universal stress protein [Kitasatospora sp. CM 4170]WNM43365.1 universal stress protein [Kitasatospora sp. CM 4170]
MTSASERRPIVFGVDALEPRPMALAWAADEAGRRGLPLRLLHAVPPASHDLRGFEEGRYHKVLREHGDAALERAADFARGRRPELDLATVVADGNPVQALCRESAHAGLVVLGSRRMNRLGELFSALSVTVPVSAQAHCPVVVVREPEHITQDPPYVVVGVDGSESSAAAVDVAFDLAARRGAALRAVWVWQSQLIAHFDEEAAGRTLRRLLAESTAGRAMAFPDVKLTHEVIRGHPVEELAKASRHALAVVVGRRGRGGFTGMRLGSVTHGLLHHAHCPVVTVPRLPS